MILFGKHKNFNSLKITPYSILSPLIVLTALCIAWFMLYAQDTEITYLPDPVNGVSIGSNINFQEEIGRISREAEFYPLQLYSPEIFNSNNYDSPQNRDDIDEAYKIPYGTYRIVTELQPNTYYSICGYSMDYGTKIFANGKEVANVGVVSSNPNIAKPCVNYMNFPVYTGENGMLELVMQYSNYAHNEGGGIPFLYISSAENINRFILEKGLPTYIMSGGLLLLAAYYFLDGILRKKRIGLHLAFCCVLFSLRDQWFYIVSLIPYNYNWYFHYRVVVAIIALTPMAILTMIESVFPKAVKGIVTILFVVATLIGAIVMFIVPTTEVVAISDLIQNLALPYVIYLFYCICKHYYIKKSFALTDVYILIGIAVLIATNLMDTVFNDFTPSVTRGGITPIGMLIFVITFMSVLATQGAEDEIALEKSNNEKSLLENMNNMKSELFQKMAHEIKTPLTIISGYAQLTDIQLTHNEITEETSDNLKVISSEAKRLAHLVSNIMEIPTKPINETVFECISVEEYLKYITIVCKGLLEKKGNTLTTKFSKNISILGNMEMLVQLMVNLAVNSNKNMNNGQFTIEVIEENINNTNVVSFIISDTGVGISKENANKIFEKGFSTKGTKGTKGFGLSICKDIIELHKGNISLVEHNGKGAIFKITMPIYTEMR